MSPMLHPGMISHLVQLQIDEYLNFLIRLVPFQLPSTPPTAEGGGLPPPAHSRTKSSPSSLAGDMAVLKGEEAVRDGRCLR